MSSDWGYEPYDRSGAAPVRCVVACLGSSTTAGRGQAFNWIGELQKRPQNQAVQFHNFGVGGDLTFNALERLPEVIAARPDKVLINIGANDILALVFENMGALLKRWKKLPQEPSREWFEENLRTIISRLKLETSARLTLVSLPQAGEDLASADPVQKDLNARYQDYNHLVKQIAEIEGADYIPFYERLNEEMVRSPGKALTAFHISDYYRDSLRHFVLHESGDEIGARHGWKFHVDGIHLNSRSGLILAELVQQFLDR